MNTISPPVCASESSSILRVVLSSDHKVSTVALELVRAAAEYQTRVNRNEDISGLVAEFSARFGIDARLSDGLLAGKLATEIDGDQLFVNTTLLQHEPEPVTTRRAERPEGAIASSKPGADERARRMHSVMSMHSAACGASGHGVATLGNVCELLCDLRHWCDEQTVDLYQALDRSYASYLRDKHHHLCWDRDLP